MGLINRNAVGSKATVALIPNDVIGERMAGPGIRYWELARVLAHHFPVHLIVPPYIASESALPTLETAASVHFPRSTQAMRALLQDCDVIVTLGIVLAYYPFLAACGKPLVFDLYDPFLLAGLQRESETDWPQRLDAHEKYLQALRMQLRAGDFFLCAGEKQRDYWLGALSGLGRLNPYTYDADPSLRNLIDGVSFGLPADPPQHTHQVLKGVHPAIGAEDKVILWGGGIWNWFDAPTMIRAMARIVQQREDVKLFFMGTRRPNLTVAKMEAVDEAIALSKDLNLADRFVIFNDWVPYAERQNYLLEADVGVSLHLDYVETRFSFRTRLLDYLWAGLPIVATEGDVLGESLAAQGAAQLVPAQDVAGVTERILGLLDRSDLRAEQTRLRDVAQKYRWEAVAQPLIAFCRQPYRAPDKAYVREESGTSSGVLSKAWRALKRGGIAEVVRQAQDYMRWKRQT